MSHVFFDWLRDLLPPAEKHQEASEIGDTCHSELSKDGVWRVEEGAEESIETTERIGKTRSVVSGLKWGNFSPDDIALDRAGTLYRGSVKTRNDSGITSLLRDGSLLSEGAGLRSPPALNGRPVSMSFVLFSIVEHRKRLWKSRAYREGRRVYSRRATNYMSAW